MVTRNTGSVPIAAPIALRAYARHRGVSAPSVLRAIKSGRLKSSLVTDIAGHVKIADVALADQEWTANTDLSRAPGYVKTRAEKRPRSPRPPVTAVPPADLPVPPEALEPPADDESLSLAEASAREKHWKAKLAELQFAVKSGALVDANAAAAAYADHITSAKTRLLGLPRKFKASAPHTPHADIVLLDKLLRQELDDLSVDA